MISKVLVVDDSQVQCRHAANLCEQVFADAEVLSAFNGKEALNQLHGAPADLLLIDLEMPVMDGIELISEVSRQHLGKAVIILSSKDPSLISSVGLMAEAGGLNVLACVQKPITGEILVQAAGKFSAERRVQDKAESSSNNLSGQDIAAGMQGNQFILHYQPKLTVKGILLKGVEALARWEHPEQGFIPPVSFIDAAEKVNQITPLTFHLFEMALKQKAHWKSHGLGLSLAFNLSPLSLSEDRIIDRIESLVQKYGVEPGELIFEVTENILLEDLAVSLQTLTRLRLKGFGIALDDYGTGFANAEQLVRVPATELKLDRSLINDIANKPQLEKIVKSTVNLAGELNMTTVAEGVENLEDFNRLEVLGIHLVQGYFFSRPLAPHTFTDWIASDLKILRGQLKIRDQ